MAGEGKYRSFRVAADIRHQLAHLVTHDLGDPRLAGLVIVSVSLTADLKLARIFWRLAPIAGIAEPNAGERRKDAEKALARAAGRFKSALVESLNLRFVPELRFKYDEGQEARDHIDELLEEVKRG
ncbi:MAG: 30S ribosome-binding factor RbfA [Polyangiaceae bacterium]|nr:30S ribosome-binding factor RbfA [Polyangiaceae bacterium]